MLSMIQSLEMKLPKVSGKCNIRGKGSVSVCYASESTHTRTWHEDQMVSEGNILCLPLWSLPIRALLSPFIKLQ